jgi:hypothetical protein
MVHLVFHALFGFKFVDFEKKLPILISIIILCPISVTHKKIKISNKSVHTGVDESVYLR